MSGTRDGQVSERRELLRALGLGTAAAAAGIGTAEAQRADAVPAKDARKESEAQRLAARYRESDHVKAFYRTNAYES
ncbi:hypothetical protein [Dankookia sp. P2]|uniref:hypothetical protein n=1 Tax=Dankookia sp. P2 TaxID=3423955 RepID=UPI003D671F05